MALSGDQALLARLRAQRKQVPAEMRQATQEMAQEVLQAAQQAVPVDTGELRESGAVRVDGEAFEVVFTAPHAAAVHERMDVAHGQGQAKFLEQPFTQSLSQLNRVWQGAVNRGLT